MSLLDSIITKLSNFSDINWRVYAGKNTDPDPDRYIDVKEFYESLQPISEKNAANGYAGLDASGKISDSQLPAIAIAEYLGNFTDLATALADSGVNASQKGDWLTTDENGGTTYIVITDNPTLSAHVKTVKTPTDMVLSVFGRTGGVTAQSGDYDADKITETAGRVFVTPAQKIVLGNTSGTNSGDQDLSGYALKNPAIVSVTSAITLDASHDGKIIEANGTFTITFPNGMLTNMKVDIVNVGTGIITLAASTTLQTKDSNKKLANQYGGASIYHRGSNVWLAVGDLSA